MFACSGCPRLLQCTYRGGNCQSRQLCRVLQLLQTPSWNHHGVFISWPIWCKDKILYEFWTGELSIKTRANGPMCVYFYALLHSLVSFRNFCSFWKWQTEESVFSKLQLKGLWFVRTVTVWNILQQNFIQIRVITKVDFSVQQHFRKMTWWH